MDRKERVGTLIIKMYFGMLAFILVAMPLTLVVASMWYEYLFKPGG